MANREFKPSSFGVDKSFFAEAMESAIGHSGEYVVHKLLGADEQSIAMKYDFVPQDASIGRDYVISGTNPTLNGYIEHFDDYPLIYKAGNGVHSAKGSQFEIKGILYNVKRVDVNHRGFVTIELVASNNCADADPDFEDKFDGLMCERDCIEIPQFKPKKPPRTFEQC